LNSYTAKYSRTFDYQWP